jgi:hypothetical protein
MQNNNFVQAIATYGADDRLAERMERRGKRQSLIWLCRGEAERA